MPHAPRSESGISRSSMCLPDPPPADTVAVPAVFLAVVGEAEHAREERRRRRELALPGAHRVKTEDLPVGGHRTLVPGAKQSLVGGLDERELLSVRIDERDRSLAAPRLVARDVRSALR